ncbi:MAG TPA: AraC family transcriptional regulator [Oscillospiraceae bacterium]|nr:AraC family transcriptional regulator [Oscillospiraceae bacterium]HPS35275.1 AraC family transcriptional regulator [Oscillospiraceae bacterium]
MQEQLSLRCEENAGHLSVLSGVPVRVFDTYNRVFIDQSTDERKKFFCSFCGNPKCNPENTHFYGCNEAYRWNGKYIYYCPIGLVFCASSVTDDSGKMLAGMIAGPVIMGEQRDSLAEIKALKTREAAQKLPVFTTQKVNALSSCLLASAVLSSGIAYGLAGSFVYEQEKQLNAIFSAHSDFLGEQETTYPIEYEKTLHRLIVEHDKSGAQALLNELLGFIYFSSNYDLDTIRERSVELVVLLSRSIIDAGADVKEIFLSNSGYIHEIEQFTSVEQLNVWLSVMLHRFINYTFDFTQVKHSDVVFKAMNYIKANYAGKITLDDIAKHVFLSRSYLSTVFKDDTGMSVTDYIKHIRIEKSKLFLLDNRIKLADIAALCGFEDQSYFTKVFRSEVGISPKKFRDSGGRIVNISSSSNAGAKL